MSNPVLDDLYWISWQVAMGLLPPQCAKKYTQSFLLTSTWKAMQTKAHLRQLKSEIRFLFYQHDKG